MINKVFATFLLLLVSMVTFAQQQDTEKGPVNEFFRSNDKIYVIVGVLLIIFAGIVIFLISLDRKISKLEKRDNLDR